VGSNPIEGAARFLARYANRRSGRAQTLVIAGSNPARAMIVDSSERRLGMGRPSWL